MRTSLRAFRYWVVFSICAAVVLGGVNQSAAEPRLMKKTYTYKVVDDCSIELDVYRADDDVLRPVVVWIHGGALMLGSRQGVSRGLLDLCRSEGFVLVSIDYRLAPRVKLPAIIEDVQDALRWIRRKGPTLFHVLPNKLVVAGGSAGGYLTMMTGICVEPRPTALVAYWGYGDFYGASFAGPSPHHRDVKLSPQEVQVFRDAEGKSPPRRTRGDYYHYLRRNGLWAKEVTGFDPDTQPKELDPYCPVRNVTSQYPPILMLHGSADTDVPYEKSAAMARQLARHGVPHELITVPGAGHGLSGGDKKLVADSHARALAFVKQHLK